MHVPLYLSGVVIISPFLDLGKNTSFSDSLLGLTAKCLGDIFLRDAQEVEDVRQGGLA
jgi:hypothetical protein